jgi:hypothetical protein
MKLVGWARSCCWLLSLGLTACGGTGDVTEALSVQARPIKSLAFDWPAAAQATHYQLLEDPDGPDGPAPEAVWATLPGSSRSHTRTPVFLPDQLQARYRLRVCQGTVCRDGLPVAAASLNAGIGYFKASNTAANDQFGQGLALSANARLMAVGAPFEDGIGQGVDPLPVRDPAASDSGAVYLFEPLAGGWAQTHYLKPQPAFVGGGFGQSLALSADGTVLLVGALGPAGADGQAYVFRRSAGSAWQQEAVLPPPTPEAGAQTGYQVALSGDGEWAMVSQPYSAGGGAVHVYRHGAGGWTLAQTLQGSNTEAGDGFGESIALSRDGTTLVVGAFGDDAAGADAADNSATDAGAAHVFTRDNVGHWAQARYLKASQPQPGGWFGAAVAVSGDGSTVVVGEPREFNAPTAPQRVQVFSGWGSWLPEAALVLPQADAVNGLGWALSVTDDGQALAVASPWDRGNDAGLGAPPGSPTLGAAGAVYLLRRAGAHAWSAPTRIKAPNNQADNYFGWTTVLSGDGSALAVYGSDASAGTGVGGAQDDRSAFWAGAVYLY